MMAQYLKLRTGEVVPPPADQAEVIELCAAGALWVDVELSDPVASEPEPNAQGEEAETAKEDSNNAEGEAAGEPAAVEESSNTTKRGKKGGKS